MPLKHVAIQTDVETHYVDHLGVLCAILGVPFLFTDDDQYEIARKYYPGLKAELVDWMEVTPEPLMKNYDVILSSYCWDRQLFEEAFEMCQEAPRKKMRSIYCPHGNSDKGEAEDHEQLLNADAVLIYGQHMMNLLKELNVWQRLGKYALTGNYRNSYYLRHQKFYDQLVNEEILSYFPEKKKILLYSPTWNTDFFTTHVHVLENIPEHLNVIVKVHPRLMQDHLGMMLCILERYKERKNILFLTDFPLIFPLLSQVDIYVGDVSSIGYDFLAFNRPMFFLNSYPHEPNAKRCFFLYQCGVELFPSDYHRLYSIIDHHLSCDNASLQARRQHMYHYAFGPEKSFHQIRKDVFSLSNL